MPRTPRGSTARKRRAKMHLFASGARGAYSTLTRVIAQEIAKALASSYRDRARQKEGFSSFVNHWDKWSNLQKCGIE